MMATVPYPRSGGNTLV